MTYDYQFYSHPALIFHYLLESIKLKYSTELYAKWRRQSVRYGCCKTNSGFNLNSAFFFLWPTERWHMVQKITTLIFRSEIPNDELFNMVYLFCSDLPFFFQKISKNCTRWRPLQKWRTLVLQVWTQELLSWTVQKQGHFSSVCIVYLCAKYWHIIGITPNHLR